MEEEKEEVRVDKKKKDDEEILRIFSLVVILSVVIADYLGYQSQYSSFLLGGSATVYALGRKGLLIIIAKATGYSIKEIDDFIYKKKDR